MSVKIAEMILHFYDCSYVTNFNIFSLRQNFTIRSSTEVYGNNKGLKSL